MKPMKLILAVLTFVLGMNLLLNAFFTAEPMAQAATSASNILLEKGKRELDKAEFAAAIRLFEQAVAANPLNADAFTYLGRSYQLAGIPSRAYKYYGIALEIDPNELRALSWSGQVDSDESRDELAAEKLTRLQRLCGTSCPEYQSLKRAIDTSATPVVGD